MKNKIIFTHFIISHEYKMFYALGVLHRWCCPHRQPAATELNERNAPAPPVPAPSAPIPESDAAPAAPPSSPITAVFQDSSSEDDTYSV